MNGTTIALIQAEVDNARATAVQVDEYSLTVSLEDGRTVSVPLLFYPRLAHGSLAERRNWEIIGLGTGIHWEELDEDISIAGIILGRKSGESPNSFSRWLEGRKSSADAEAVASIPKQRALREERTAYKTSEAHTKSAPRRLLGFSLAEYIEAALAIAEYERDEDGETIIAEVPGGTSFFTQGETFELARENLRDAIEQVVLSRIQLGWDIPAIPGVEITETMLDAAA